MPRPGTAHHNAKMTPEQVQQLRHLHYDAGICMACAAKLVGVARQTAHDAITFKTWKTVQDGAVPYTPPVYDMIDP